MSRGTMAGRVNYLRKISMVIRLYRACAALALCTGMLGWSISSDAIDLQLTGTWQLNDDLSDDVEDALEDKLRRAPKGIEEGGNFDRNRNGQRQPHEISQDNYWSLVQKSRDRRSMRNLRRLGTAYPLLTIKTIKISQAEDNFEFLYDDVLPRFVKPNPAGRAYSAKGDELVSDSLGHTLTYWDKAELVLETEMPSGGKFIERLKLTGQPAQLHYSIKLKMVVLQESVTIKRVFERSQ